MTIEVRPVVHDEDAEAWRQVHNAVIPAHALSMDDVRDRVGRNRLSLGFVDGELVGNATIRPATDETPTTVIVRILPAYRRHGYGTDYWGHLVDEDPSLRRGPLATVVLTANQDGLRFAATLGFVEVERYEVDGAEYADLHRATPRT